MMPPQSLLAAAAFNFFATPFNEIHKQIIKISFFFFGGGVSIYEAPIIPTPISRKVLMNTS